MTAARPSFPDIVIAAYWDLGRALRAQRGLAIFTALLVVAAIMARSIVPAMLSSQVAVKMMIRHGIDIAGMVLAAPFLLAVHRFVLLGEPGTWQTVAPGSARFQSFCGWLVVFMLAASIPSLLYVASLSYGPVYYVGRPPAADMKPFLLLMLASLVVLAGFVRMILLLPAVAVDAPGASWQNALYDTHRNLRFVSLACVLPLVPVALMGAALMPVATIVPFGRHFVWSVIVFLAATLLAVVAARLYQVLGVRVSRAPRSG